MKNILSLVCAVIAACACNADIGDPAFAFDGDVVASAEGAAVITAHVQQEESLWCWAAVGQMVLASYGKEVPQCEIANMAFASHADYGSYQRAVGTDCCDADDFGRRLVCNQMGYEGWGVEAFGISGVPVARPLEEDELRHALSNGRPVAMSIQHPEADFAHVMVIGSYDIVDGSALYTVLDPSSTAPLTVAYDALRGEWSGRIWSFSTVFVGQP